MSAPQLDRANWSHLTDEQFKYVSSLATIFGVDALPYMLSTDTAVHVARLHQYAQLVHMHASPAIERAEVKAREEVERTQGAAQEKIGRAHV